VFIENVDEDDRGCGFGWIYRVPRRMFYCFFISLYNMWVILSSRLRHDIVVSLLLYPSNLYCMEMWFPYLSTNILIRKKISVLCIIGIFISFLLGKCFILFHKKEGDKAW